MGGRGEGKPQMEGMASLNHPCAATGHNSVPVKDNCAMQPTPPIFAVGQSNGVIQIYPLTTTVVIATIQKLQKFALHSQWRVQSGITLSPWEIIARCLHLPPYFRGRAFRRCHLNFSPVYPRCHGNEFWDKIDYNSAPVKDNCARFAPTTYIRARAFRRCI